MKASIIIRTKNEERWISECLRAVYRQTFKDFEVIVVDNQSSDMTLQKVGRFGVDRIVHCREYLPGKALNIGIRESRGEFIVCLSGHCIPVDEFWLENLHRNMADPETAGVYGRQAPLSFTPDRDKRDLLIVFGPERRVQKKDSFFHNANSMIRRELWEKYPFDERITNIEDRIWAQTVLKHGWSLVYEPEAAVYHHHGIHHDGDQARCRNVTRILESISQDEIPGPLGGPEKPNGPAVIPVRGRPPEFQGRSLLEYTVEAARKSKYIDSVIISTDNRETLEMGLEMGCDQGVLREEEMSREYVGLEEVYSYTLKKLEDQGRLPDFLTLLEIKYPFRPEGVLDELIQAFLTRGLDTILPYKTEYEPVWLEKESGLVELSGSLAPRKFKKPVFISCKGICCVTRPHLVREGRIFGPNLGMFRINDPLAFVEIRDTESENASGNLNWTLNRRLLEVARNGRSHSVQTP